MQAINRVGQQVQRRTPLTVKGGQLHLIDGPDDRVLVALEGERWRPIAGLQQLSALWKSTSPSERQSRIGLWQDRWRWGIIPPDGKIQRDEVETLGQRWEEEFLLTPTAPRVGTQESQWLSHYCKVLPTNATVQGSVLLEPARIVRSELERVTRWACDPRLGSYPLKTEIIVYQ